MPEVMSQWTLQDLNDFKSRVAGLAPEEQLQDHFLLQWLTARNFNVDKAESMFKKSQDWHKELDMDHILEWEAPEVLVKYVPQGCVGFDKFGGTVLIIPHGRVDIRGILMSVTPTEHIKFTVQTIEKCKVMMAEESKRRGYPVCQQTCIFDLEGFSFKDFTWKPALESVIALMQVYEANYPELLRVGYVINAPKIFTVAFTLVKPFLHEATINKIKIFGRSGWQEEILQDIDAEVLPKHWGGNRVDPDGNEMCPSLVCLGGAVPKEYYLKNKAKENRQHLTTITVPKGGNEKLSFTTTEPNSVIKWEFETEDYDISFGIYKQDFPDDHLVAPHRVNSHLVPEEGEVVCPSPGTYIVQFDNSFSYLRAKKLHYSVAVLKPQN
ncbi:SEC14-like protein 2 isoform X2 [Hyalella azteca]|uniref:SEC14-like protein 2 isoform X2 n=1 Tax=Hyalella azteca TaxID=294128 RepID=A0A979FTQ4_HYAAZ|nr:SEC14-like protein 2 isoform X2 [Hyalella azteca]